MAAAWPTHAASGARQCDQRAGSALGGSTGGAPRSQVTLRAGSDRGRGREREDRGFKEATHLWQGVAPGSDGHTHRIFDRAHDWHARGRYFWTSGVARERSPDAGVESGMVTASRVPGEDQDSAGCGWFLCSDSGWGPGLLLEKLETVFPFLPIIKLCRGRGQWTSGQPRRLCAPGRLCCAFAACAALRCSLIPSCV